LLLAAIVVFFYLFVVLFDFVPIAKSVGKKERLIYFVLLTASFTILILYTFNIKTPGPTGLIELVIKSLFGI
jgi:hypothetical protein